MQIIRSRRDFLASLSAAGAASVLGARASLADEGPPEVTTIRHRVTIRTSASRRSSSPRTCCARKGSPTSATWRPPRVSSVATRRDRLRSRRSPHWLAVPIDAGEPITALAGVHVGCFELFAHDADPNHQRPARARASASSGWARARTCCSRSWRACRARPPHGHQLDRQPRRRASRSCSPPARSMLSSASRPSRRSCAPARSVA